VLIFARYPERGKVKTRLVSDHISKEEVLELYCAFLLDTIDQSILSCADYIFISLNSSTLIQEKDLHQTQFFKFHNFNETKLQRNFHQQKTDDFGENMRNAISWTFQQNNNISKLIVIGADTPNISPYTINYSFTMLDSCSLVLGPSGSAGVYLIGMKRENSLSGFEKLFTGIELTNFVKYVRNNFLTMQLIEELSDIDNQHDLIGLISWIEAAQTSNELSMGDIKPISIPKRTKEVLDKLMFVIGVNEKDNRKKRIIGKDKSLKGKRTSEVKL
jgi:glycosyltransferase A (GT-A) superfamily protein (DUF2064 family)